MRRLYLMTSIFYLLDSTMKKILVFIFFILGFSYTNCQISSFLQQYESVLKTYQQGPSVDYRSIDFAEIQGVTTTLETSEWQSLKGNEKIAFLANAYNAHVIAKIKANYPIRSVGEVTDFFQADINVGGLTTNLDDLEKMIVGLGGGSMHLLLNCGAISCPPLQFIKADRIEDHIHDAMNRDVMVQEEESIIKLSQIFNWYADDFGGKDKVRAFVEKYTENKIEGQLRFQSYNWLLNDISLAETNIYFPTRLYRKGEGELKFFNNYYTQSDNGIRSNFFSTFVQLLIGTNKRVNLGFDLKFRSVSSGSVRLLDALNFRNQSFSDINGLSTFARIGISGIGPRIKYQPFKNKPNINFLHTVYFVPMDEAEGNGEFGYSDYNNLQFFNQVFVEKELSPTRRLFLDIGLHFENIRLGVHRNFQHFTPIQMPVSIFYNYFPDPVATIYATATFAQRIDLVFNADTDTRADYSLWGQIGLGGKYIFSNFIELELLYTRFFISSFERKAHTFNLGIRLYK